MKVIVSVSGRFHAFDLARQLWRRGRLEKLITSYPAGEAVKAEIPRNLVKSLLLKEIAFRGWMKTPAPVRALFDPRYLVKDLFDRQAARRIKPCDIFVGWSGSCLRSLRRARELGAVTVVVRGSSHIVYGRNLLEGEYRRLGLEWRGIHPRIIEKELYEYREADYIVVPSEFARRSFLEMGVPGRKVVKIVYGVDLGRFRPFPKRDRVFRVVYAGSMTILKGVHHLLRAFSELNLPNSELTLIGRAADEIKPFFQKYRGKFNFLGPVPRDRLAAHYSQGSVFAFMSCTEGLGKVLMEAMSCGLPVICTIPTGGEDVVRDGTDGFLIPAGDLQTLKEKIVFLHENPGIRERMGRSARQRVSEGFTWNDYGERVAAAYERMLEESRRKRHPDDRARTGG